MQRTVSSRRKAEGMTSKVSSRLSRLISAGFLLLTACCLPPSAFCLAQQPAAPKPTDNPAASNVLPEQEEAPLPGDWAPELLDAILSSPNAEAHEALYRAAFAAGPAIVPQLAAGLKDDRTAEFAAQTLAFLGGERALEILWKAVSDPRDLNLRRFYYGALGEFDSPQAIETLFQVIGRSDAEPDRTVTEAAVLALTIRSDLKLLPRIREAEAKIHDVVIRDDLDNALEVIERRAKYLASPEGKKAGGSVQEAVRTYFIPALEPLSPPNPAKPAPQSTGRAPEKPQVKVEVQTLTLSPDKTRALARVVFEDPSAVAQYDIVLQKRYGDWTIASVWLGSETEKPAPPPARLPAKQP
jgi:hypothetical protein